MKGTILVTTCAKLGLGLPVVRHHWRKFFNFLTHRRSFFFFYCTFTSLRRTATQVLLGSLTGLALVLKDAGFIVSFNGALMGSAIIYLFPPLMFLKSTASKVLTPKLRRERTFNKFLIALGVVVAILGGSVSVLDSFFPAVLKG